MKISILHYINSIDSDTQCTWNKESYHQLLTTP